MSYGTVGTRANMKKKHVPCRGIGAHLRVRAVDSNFILFTIMQCRGVLESIRVPWELSEANFK